MSANDTVYLDPNFFLPPNVVDFRYGSVSEDGSDNLDEVSPEKDGATNLIDSTTLVNYGTASSLIPIPTNVTVVSQTVRALAGGGYAVDVIFEIPDIPGVETFDLSVTKQ